MLEPPPSYTSPSTVSLLPVYTEIHGANEQTLAIQPLVPSSVSGLDYEYSTKHMSMNLGRRIHGTSAPSYGRNSVIQALITIKSFKHVKDISVTIWGKAIVTVSDRGFPLFHDVRIVLFHTIPLWSSSRDGARPTGPRTYPISYPLPTYARSRGTALPPTMSTAFQSLDVDVRYHIKIDMVRQGLHRHECTSTVLFYLPRSVPTSLSSVTSAFEEVEAKSEAEEDVQWKMTEIIPNGNRNNVILQSIRSKVQVQLLKTVSVMINKQRVRMDRVMGTGMVWSIDTGDDSGVWEVTGSVKGGREGGEVSWSLTHFVEIRYTVRLVIASIEGFPEYKHDEVVQLVTHEAQDLELEEVRERPALGLINVRESAPSYNSTLPSGPTNVRLP
ncbi:hypothetical protein FRB97_003490 [Tulasnella sp. 331]|nr:hypothetical protein FRB97_003490 [Tulasnella sp. 331]KAG8889679.1 hypothetical protein FRB98_003242 [Tulasnella sp. 332]